jgi:membrane fusion protein, multidrug efflux system
MAIVSKSFVATLLVVLLVVCGGYYVYEQTGHDKAQATTAGPAVPVTVAISEARDVPVFVRGLGNVQAFKTVAVKTRVDGQIVGLRLQRR